MTKTNIVCPMTMVIDAAKKGGGSVLGNVFLKKQCATRMFIDKIADVVDVPGDTDQIA